MNREEIILNFLHSNGIKYIKIELIPSDASFRKYRRIFLNSKESLILMDSDPKYCESLDIFVNIDRILREIGVNAPEIFAIDEVNGLMLLEDFGDDTYKKFLLRNSKMELELYKKAIDILIRIKENINVGEFRIPSYNKEKYMQEVSLFLDWYVKYISGIELSKSAIADFNKIWDNILSRVNYSNNTLVLRDFHSENLMYCNGKIGVIDFQDALIGSPAYDLFSLLGDIRYRISNKNFDELIDYSASINFTNDYNIIALQRNVKIIGIFARLKIRDHKPKYSQEYYRILFQDLTKDLRKSDIFLDFRKWLHDTKILIC